MMESIAQQAAKDARDVFSDDRQAQAAIGYMEQLVYAALRNVEYDLSDPVAVHANMLRGAIAKPTVEQIIHLYGVDALAKALAPVIVREAAPDALHRSFPEAGDGRPMPPMGDELMTAGLDAEDARFVAVQLAQNGWTLTPTPVDASQTPDPAVNDDDDGPCTTCGGTGITYQTERRCACLGPDPAAIREAWEKAYWRMRSYALHDNDCKLNKPPHFNGPCSCGLTAALEEALALIQKGAAEPTEYERKVAQMKKDFPNGI